MKKILSVILAVAVLFSFAAMLGCSKDDAAPAPEVDTAAPAESEPSAESGEMSAEALAATKPGEYLNEKLAAGMTPLLAFCACADNYFVSEQLGGGIRDYVVDLGFDYNFTSSDLNMATMISQIENFIEMKAAIIVALPNDAGLLRDITLEAEKQGTHVIIYGVEADFGICATSDMELMGRSIAEMAIAWADVAYPDAGAGELKTAVMGQTAVTDLIIRTDAMKAAIIEDERFSVAFESEIEDSIDVGFTRMEEAYTTDPDIKVVLCTSAAGAIGCNNYMTSLDGVDLSGVGVFCNDFDSALEECIAQSGQGNGCLRGSIILGREPASGTIMCIQGIMDGSIQSPYLFLHPLTPLTTDEFEYSMA